VEQYKRRPPGEYQPKADRLDALPLRQHEDVAGGAFSREAEAKLFGEEGTQSAPVRSLRDDRHGRPASENGRSIPKAERSGPMQEKSLAPGAAGLIAATWRKQPLEPALREAMGPVRPKQAPSACASALFVVLVAVLLLFMALGFITGAR